MAKGLETRRDSIINIEVEDTKMSMDNSASPRKKMTTRPSLTRMKSAMRGKEVPFLELTMYFVAYKGMLLILAFVSSHFSVYDTSSTLLNYRTILNHWDSVYFSHVSEHGYIFEQEFAFGPLLPGLLNMIHPILLGCACHYIAVLTFYKASLSATSSERVSKLSALLLIISPAGIFLCIGYTEPVYAALSFTAISILHDHPYLSAALFGLSGLTRATGIMSVLFFLPRRPTTRRVMKSAVYGSIICTPWLLSQAYAYYLYCPDRPWCAKFPPLIYAYVQDRYWNVGFGRYFTLNNLPLFIISAPMYILCIISLDFSLFSVQQVLLTFITFTSAHAQVITRISSAFPRIYWYLAKMLVQDKNAQRWRYVVVFFILYGMIQAVLFGAFLPPA